MLAQNSVVARQNRGCAGSAFAAWRAAVVSCVTLLVAGCGTTDGPEIGGRGMACVDDSPTCVSERSIALNHLINDKQRAWVQQPASPESYASGVRLFAFKQKKKELPCDELAIGRREADAGPVTLRGPQGKGLSPAQISRGVIFAGEVSRELDNEMKRRCRA